MDGSPGNVAPRILSRPEHNLSRKNIDPDALKVLYRLKNSGFVAYLVGGGVRDLLLERRAQGLRHRHQRPPAAGAQALPQLLHRGPPLPPRPRALRAEGGRGLDLPQGGGAGGRRHPHPPRQHLRHPRGGRVPPRLHGERPLLRHRQLLGDRLGARDRGPDRPRHPDDRRPRRALPRGPGAHAARGGARRAARLHDRPGHRGGPALPARRDRAQQLRPHPRGVLQDPAPGPLPAHLRDAARARAARLHPPRGGPRDLPEQGGAPRLARRGSTPTAGRASRPPTS